MPAESAAVQPRANLFVEKVQVCKRVVGVQHGKPRVTAHNRRDPGAVHRAVHLAVFFHLDLDRGADGWLDADYGQQAAVRLRLSDHRIDIDEGQNPGIETSRSEQGCIADCEFRALADGLWRAPQELHRHVGDLDIPFHENAHHADAKREGQVDPFVLKPLAEKRKYALGFLRLAFGRGFGFSRRLGLNGQGCRRGKDQRQKFSQQSACLRRSFHPRSKCYFTAGYKRRSRQA